MGNGEGIFGNYNDAIATHMEEAQPPSESYPNSKNELTM